RFRSDRRGDRIGDQLEEKGCGHSVGLCLAVLLVRWRRFGRRSFLAFVARLVRCCLRRCLCGSLRRPLLSCLFSCVALCAWPLIARRWTIIVPVLFDVVLDAILEVGRVVVVVARLR